MTAPLGSAAFEAWDHWRQYGVLPRHGGWLDQPLALLTQIQAIQLTYDSVSYAKQKGVSWAKLSATQKELLKFLEIEETSAAD